MAGIGDPAIRTRGLTKRFGSVVAVDDVDLEVAEGDRYGFLGPNGSGKTTMVRMLLGLVFATAGEVEVLGHPVPRHAGAALRDVGALVEGPAAYPHLSAATNLSLIDAAGPRHSRLPRGDRRRRIHEALEQVGLDGIGRRPVKAFSLGMRQRLGLAAAVIRRPRLLVLDEPTNGLDPQGIQEVRALLVALNEAGTTVFLSSHLLAEVEQLCSRVGVMDSGRLVVQEDLAELRRPTGRAVVRVGDPVAAQDLLRERVADVDGDRLVVRDIGVDELTRRLVEAGIAVHEAQPERRSLEDTVLALTGPGSDRVAG
ncbi:MAG: ABC transporter ATP-binding protein [Kineosporiaceae bacterium]